MSYSWKTQANAKSNFVWERPKYTASKFPLKARGRAYCISGLFLWTSNQHWLFSSKWKGSVRRTWLWSHIHHAPAQHNRVTPGERKITSKNKHDTGEISGTVPKPFLQSLFQFRQNRKAGRLVKITYQSCSSGGLHLSQQNWVWWGLRPRSRGIFSHWRSPLSIQHVRTRQGKESQSKTETQWGLPILLKKPCWKEHI